MLVNEVHTKRSLIMPAQNKCNAIGQFAQDFRDEFRITIELGFPPPWTPEKWFYDVEMYNDLLLKQRNNIE
jgi:hypothetical protein